jgi:hypothetical protein
MTMFGCGELAGKSCGQRAGASQQHSFNIRLDVRGAMRGRHRGSTREVMAATPGDLFSIILRKALSVRTGS